MRRATPSSTAAPTVRRGAPRASSSAVVACLCAGVVAALVAAFATRAAAAAPGEIAGTGAGAGTDGAGAGGAGTAAAGDVTKQISAQVTSAKAWAQGEPAGWLERAFDDRGWLDTRAPIVPRVPFTVGGAPPAGTTSIDVQPGASLLLRTRFDVGDVAAARVIDLRVAYLDGFVAYLNGVEIARRNLPAAPIHARPPLPHGAEPERIFIPVAGRIAHAILAKDNLLAVEIRPATGRLPNDANAPAGEASIALASGTRLVRGPYLIAPGERTVSVAWETDLPSRGTLVVDPDAGNAKPSRRLPAATVGLRHVVRVDGLEAGHRYDYHVETEGQRAGDRDASVPATFETAPTREAPMRFVVYGDMRAPGHAAHAQIVAAILRERPALVVNTGDLVAIGGEESSWQRYFEITAPLGAIATVAPALGNHEAYVNGSAKSWALFGLKSESLMAGYTSFDWGGAHFLILDSNHFDRAQRDWMERDLAAARKHAPRAIFAVCHDGAWSHGVHGGSHVMEHDFAPLLAAAGVDVAFGGHDHLYERGVGVTPRGPLPYIVSGGGGAPLYSPSCQPVGAASSTADDAGGGGEVSGATDARPAGAPSPLPPCPPSVAIIRKTYHYIAVEVADHTLRVCPRLPDGAPLEPCVELPLHAHGTDAAHGRPR